ncbi:hypothetical protein CEXT_15061 [Caerostris extrusa]|uniref:Uncharacterized protein n=1 Tax=Caerostris extrusa TaxID=172846 RepID=A0AAV4MCZ1_CAEEX|nr:hypothetical protein CEXT_15061 [Caerostris extrusa]
MGTGYGGTNTLSVRNGSTPSHSQRAGRDLSALDETPSQQELLASFTPTLSKQHDAGDPLHNHPLLKVMTPVRSDWLITCRLTINLNFRAQTCEMRS